MKIELTQNELETVLNALANLPYNVSAPLINNITVQATEQLTEANADKKLDKA
jgi:16S rRNA A1518/A1519 N6-dimethyltransferase RsmA/KsgA/DIM1 with predicted DNA glycosylase/AP lyase activity